MKLLSVKRITHYPKNDRNFEGDYSSVDLEVVTDDKKKHKLQWLDAYHDKGFDKSEGALAVLTKLFGPFTTIEKNVADAPAWD